ncbi:MAG: hypothetical protein NTY38_20595, partial [Acidobacteria bacterium]|nr:hypothetical protein [Acidobacteriota bacterium]
MVLLSLLYRLIVRPLGRQAPRTVLTILAVALGVGVVVAIELAGQAAAGSFRASMETLSGDADFDVTAVGGVPAQVAGSLATLPQAVRVRSRIEDHGLIAGKAKTVPVFGVDLVADAVLVDESGAAPDVASLSADDAIWAGPDLGYLKGDQVNIVLNDTEHEFTVRGVLGPSAGEALVMDLGVAARFLGRAGTVDRILIQGTLDEPALRALLPAGCTLARFGAKTDEN